MRRTVLTCLVSLALVCPALAQESEASRAFGIVLDSTITMDLGANGSAKIGALTGFDYTFKGTPQKFAVQLDRMAVKQTTDGVLAMDMEMSLAGFKNVTPQETLDVPYEEGNPQLQGLLDAAFRNPIANLELDADFRETKREVVAGPDAQGLLENGAMENSRLFHAPFPAEGDSWEAERAFSMGNGNLATGKLTYTRGETVDGRTTVSVKGTLNGRGMHGPLEIKSAVYEISGTQQFDPAVGDYVAGTLDVKISMELAQGGQVLGNGKGTIKATLSQRN